MAKAKQQGNGSGTVYPRKNKEGKITGYLGSYHDLQGRRRYVSAKNKTDCRDKLRTAMGDADKGIVYDSGTTTVSQYLDRWLTDSVDGTVRQRTYERYEQIVRVHLKPGLGRQQLKTLTPAHVRSLYKEKLLTLSPRTVNYIHVTLHKALKDAVSDGLVPRNVCDAVKSPRPGKKEVTPLTQNQARSLLAAARGDRLEALYIVALHCGLRQGELLGLKWEDVDLNAGTLSVRRTLSETRMEGFKYESPKSGKGRSVKLSQGATDALRIHRKRQLEEQAREVEERFKGLVFTTTNGTPYTCTNLLSQRFRPLLKRAELPAPTRFHDLRHTCATMLLKMGQHPKYVQELLGHASISITLDTHSHVIEGMGDGLADAMDGAL